MAAMPRLILVLLVLLWPARAFAQLQNCTVTFDPVTLARDYNPLDADDFVVSFNATGYRSGLAFAGKFSALLMRQSNDSIPYELIVLSDDGSGVGSVLYQPPGPVLRTGLNDSGEIDLDYGIVIFNNSRTFQMQLRIPAGTDLPAGVVHAVFDVKYLCEFGFLSELRGINLRAFTVNFNVASAVQASLVGQDPNFGEIGNLSDTDVAGAPPSTTQRRHFLRVASTGPYEVRVESQNQWRMTATGAPSNVPAERIRYRYELLGQTLESSRPNFTPVSCRAAGIAGQNIPLTATLTEGGQGKTVSPNYRDIITVTITPMAANTGGTVQCP